MAIGNMCPQPAEIWAHSNVELRSVADVEGLRFRDTGHGGEILAMLGMAVVFLPGGELYEAMQRGVIDAFEYSSPVVDWPMGFQEVTDYHYFSASWSPNDPLAFYVNRSKFEALPPDLKAIVEQAVIAGTDQHHQWLEYESMYGVQRFIDYGNVVAKLPADIDRALLEATEEYYAEKAAVERPLYQEILDSLAEFKRAWAEYAEPTAFEAL